MLFTKPKNEITFEDIEDFCRKFGEDVRVEYKREIKHIPKIVSAFANTHGGVFIIGAETDEQNKVTFPIQGIPQKSGIEEGIQQSALTGIYPGVIPEIIRVDVPDSSNLVVIVRVDESIHAPHAIQNSTRTYIRVGSITQPYEYKLAEMDRLAYMFKRREDSQAITRQILDRIEKRVEAFSNINASNITLNVPNITMIAKPIFPYRPVISKEDILHLKSSWRRVTGGAYKLPNNDYGDYCELNEYGIVYQRAALELQVPAHGSEQYLDFDVILHRISDFLSLAKSFYKKCEYTGNIECTVQLREVFGANLYLDNVFVRPRGSGWQRGPHKGSSSDVSTSIQCLPRDFDNNERLIEIVEGFASDILWAFDTVKPQNIRDVIVGALKSAGLID